MCLESLTRLDYPRDRFEVIVVDDGSDTPVGNRIDPAGYPYALLILPQPHAGPATARNTGAAHAGGVFLAFMDDDCVPAPDWLTALAARFADAPDCAVGGRTVNALPDNACATASQLLVDYLYEYYNQDPDHARFLTSSNLAFPADRFRAVGGFDGAFPLAAAEDRELCDRWRQHGYRMIYAPEAVVHHAHTMTLRNFWQQHVNYGRGARRFHRIHARCRQEWIRVKPLSFYWNLLRYPFARPTGRRAPVIAFLLAVSQTATVCGYIRER